MSSKKQKRIDVDIEIKKQEDDPMIAKVIANVNILMSTEGALIDNPNIKVSGKKIKITQLMIEAAYKKLLIVIDNNEVDTESVAIIVAYALQISNEMLNTSKTYKVELTLAIMRKLIDDEVKDPDKRVILHMLVESTLPSLIDTIQGLPSLLSKMFSKCRCC
jgi:hypothetical protein